MALGSDATRIAHPFATLQFSTDIWQQLGEIIRTEEVNQLVLGLPRGLEGQETAQTRATLEFAEALKQLGLQVHLQDEAVTSERAKSILRQSSQTYDKADVDAMAAAIILQDYLDAL